MKCLNLRTGVMLIINVEELERSWDSLSEIYYSESFKCPNASASLLD
jgi:hypothetical protein